MSGPGVNIEQIFGVQFATFGDLLSAIVYFLFGGAFIVTFFFLIFGGIRWIISGGDEKAMADARNTITFALLGLAVVILSFTFIKLIEAFTKITILR
jgi:hypothetical protein